MNEYKGIYYNDNNEQRFYEGGAHFKYSDLFDCLERIQHSLTKQRGSSQQKPKTRNQQQHCQQLSQVQYQHNIVNINNIYNPKLKKQNKLTQVNTRNSMHIKPKLQVIHSNPMIKKSMRNISMDIKDNKNIFKKKNISNINNNIINHNNNINSTNKHITKDSSKVIVDYSIKVKTHTQTHTHTHTLLSNNTNSTSTCSGTKTKINLPKQNVKHKTQTRNILNNRILSSSSCITVSDYINCKRLIGKTLLNNNNDTNKSNLTNKKSRNSKQSSVIFKNSIDKNKTCAMLSHLKGTFKVSRNTTKPKEVMNKTTMNVNCIKVNSNNNVQSRNNCKGVGISNYSKITLHKQKGSKIK